MRCDARIWCRMGRDGKAWDGMGLYGTVLDGTGWDYMGCHGGGMETDGGEMETDGGEMETDVD